MLDSTTKKRIDDCRDILVGKLPDPKAQIEQITIALIYKFMDDMDKEAIELGGKAKFFADYKIPNPKFPKDRKKDRPIEFKKYAWDNLMDPKVTASEMLALYSEAIQGMDKNPNIPQLFRDIFKNAFLPYRDPETLKLFLKTIGEFEYTHSEKLGDAFEYLLSVMGSQGDAGQFRTPRHIIDFLVAIVDPGKNDTILDPACGTAGFLISAYKHILLKHSKANKEELTIYDYNKLGDKPFNNLGDKLNPDDRKKLIQNFAGYDISPDMVRLSLVNLYLHGFSDPHIHEYDTLSSEERWNESYDVILANPPFMSPKGGIRPHKKFTINSNRSEVLFVDYIAEHLNPKGRAGIIVPEGVIFQSGTAYKDLRKMLVENYLYAVVSLPAGVFNPYSGVKTSILLMDKAVAKKRKEILFVKIDNDGYNLGAQRTPVKGSQLEEAIDCIHAFVKTEHAPSLKETSFAHVVSKTEIAKNGDYNLSGERYKNVKDVEVKYEFLPLREVCEINPETVEPSTLSSDEFIYIDISSIENGTGKVSFNTLVKVNEAPSRARRRIRDKDVLLSTVRPNLKAFGYLDKVPQNAIASTGFAILRSKQKIAPKFLYYNLFSENMVNQMISMMGKGAYPSINQTDVSSLRIPLPPLPIQEEIVAEIEGYQKIIDGAKAVLENYKPKIDIDPEWEMVELGKAPIEIIDGDRGVNYPNASDFSSEGYCLFLNTKNVRENGFRFEELMFISKQKDKLLRKGKLQRNDVLLTTRGTVGNTAFYNDSVPFENIRINSGMLIFRPDNSKILSEYLFYFFQSENCQAQFKNIISGAAQPQLPIRDLKFAKIPIPDIGTQQKVIKGIKKEQELVNANKQLIEHFQQKIKNRITKVWGE